MTAKQQKKVKKMEDKIKQVQKKYGSKAMAVAVIIGFILIIAGFKPYGKGLILGALFSVINFVLLGCYLTMTLQKSRKKASLISFASLTVRLLIMAVPLIVAIKFNSSFNIFAVIPGLFAVQAAIFTDNALGSIRRRFIGKKA